MKAHLLIFPRPDCSGKITPPKRTNASLFNCSCSSFDFGHIQFVFWASLTLFGFLIILAYSLKLTPISDHVLISNPKSSVWVILVKANLKYMKFNYYSNLMYLFLGWSNLPPSYMQLLMIIYLSSMMSWLLFTLEVYGEGLSYLGLPLDHSDTQGS